MGVESEHGAHGRARPGQAARRRRVKPWQSPPPVRSLGGYIRSPMAVRILIVEDERSIAEPFAKALAREGFETHGGHGCRGARLAGATRARPRAPRPGAPRRRRPRRLPHAARGSRRPVIMVTARGTETDRIVGLEIGADDYVVKPFSGAEVIARIRAVLRRPSRAAPTSRPRRPIAFGDLGSTSPPAARRSAPSELELSRKEFDLLAELARNAGRVVTREDLMARVWDENWFGSTKTLDVHVGWLRRKLGDDAPDPRYIHTVRGVGFRFAAPTRS